MAVTYPHLDEQRIWRSSSSSRRHFCMPYSQSSPTLDLHLVRPQRALSRSCGVCWHQQGSSHDDQSMLERVEQKRAANQALNLAVNTLRDVGRQSQGSRPKAQKRDDLAANKICKHPSCSVRQSGARGLGSERMLASRTLTAQWRCRW